VIRSHGKLTLIAAAVVCIAILMAIFAPLVSPYDPLKQDLSSLLASPGPTHLLGTDNVGRDVLARVIWGSRVSLIAGSVSVAIAVVAGCFLGLIAGYSGGRLDDVLIRASQLSFRSERQRLYQRGQAMLAEELPWLALHPAGEWVGDQLRLGKRPMRWCYRPLAWPVWNYEHRRLVRFWSAVDGLNTTAIDALASRRLDHLSVVEPSIDDLADQLREELAVSRRHLRAVLDGYWDRDWRREHTGDESPEDHLWRAATAVAIAGPCFVR